MSMRIRRNMPQAWKDALPKVCVNCGSTDDIQYHHIVPLSVGGNNILSNIVPLCSHCHDRIHYASTDRIDHGHLVKIGIQKAKERGVHVGKKRNDDERVMRLIAEYSSQFNLFSETTEREIMEMASVGITTYYRCKQLLIETCNQDDWPFTWPRPKPVRSHPVYEHVLLKERG